MAELDLDKMDKRLVQRYLRKGLLDSKEYENHLKSLPDVADKADSVEAEFEPSEAPQPGAAAQPPESGDSEA